jgi:periplasmic protein TonB
MNPKHLFLSSLWLFAFILAISCSKIEVTKPNEEHKTSYKEAPVLIESRQDYELLDAFPSFPGGDSLFRQYLKEKIKYPQSAIKNGISGKVFASYIVESDGSISNLEILKGLGYGCDDAVKDALRNMPSWSAGKIKKNHVRVKLVIPVEFK